jgi:hypothetical protein
MAFRSFPDGAQVDGLYGLCNFNWLPVKFNHDRRTLTIPALFEDFTSVDAAAAAQQSSDKSNDKNKTMNQREFLP